MSGCTLFGKPPRIRRGVTLTLVFGAVLATGAATGSFGAPDARSAAVGADARACGGSPAGPRVCGGSRPGRRTAAALLPSPAPAQDRAAGSGTAGIALAIDTGTLGARAVRRLVGAVGGRWSAFYTPQQYEGFRQELDGGYVGVGLWVRDLADGRVEVSRVQGGSPAARAGLAAGDLLTAVDGTPVAGRPVTEVVARLRGTAPTDPGDPGTAPAPRPGSAVRLTLRRAGRDWPVVLRRALLSARPVTVTRPVPGVERIAVAAFTRGVGAQVRDALARGGHRDGVLLDLRGDSGGLVTEAVRTASAFLDGGPVASYDVHGSSRALYAGAGGDTTTPLVVLVDGGTMSAAELLTGALQDRGRAVVVGSRTFGKGSVQLPSTLADGSVAELTVGHYRTPSGRRVDGVGIRPDLALPPGTPPAVAEHAAETVLSGLGARS